MAPAMNNVLGFAKTSFAVFFFFYLLLRNQRRVVYV